MGLAKKMVVMKVAVLAFLILGRLTTANFADAHRFNARLDASSFLSRVISESSSESPSSSGCCDKCICTKSHPPKCQCMDIGTSCHGACKSCICALSEPPQCRCYDINNFCYRPCSSSDS